MTIEIREVSTHRDLKTFIRFPLSLYKGNPYYVPSMFADEMNTLRRDKNPAFADCKTRYWLAYRDNKIVGRVAGLYVPQDEKKWGNKYVRFGWLDFIDDAEVVKALIDQVEGWAKELGMVGIHGPLGFTDLDREGMLVTGSKWWPAWQPTITNPYYHKRSEELGYVKDVDGWRRVPLTDQSKEKIAKSTN